MHYFRLALVASATLVTGSALAQNILVNGDFEAGNTGFGSDLSYSPSDFTPPTVYSVDTNPNNHHGSWASFGDHTSGSGLMLIANGSTDPQLSRIWFQTLTMTPGATYDFQGFARSQFSSTETLYLSVDGVQVASSDFSFGSSSWAQWNHSFVYSGSGTSVFAIHTASSQFSGNDISIDDLELSTAVPEPASMLAIAAGLAGLSARRRKKNQ